MFKNRAFQVKMVKDTDAAHTDDCSRAHYDAAEINTLLSQQVQQVAVAVVSVFALTTLVKTCSAMIIHTANTYIK